MVTSMVPSGCGDYDFRVSGFCNSVPWWRTILASFRDKKRGGGVTLHGRASHPDELHLYHVVSCALDMPCEGLGNCQT